MPEARRLGPGGEGGCFSGLSLAPQRGDHSKPCCPLSLPSAHGLSLLLPDTRPIATLLHSKGAMEAGPGSDHMCGFVLTEAGSAM